MVNWSDWSSDLIGKSMAPYETTMGVGAWILIFTGIIGYVYLKQQSYVAAAIASLVILTAFINYLYGMEAWTNLIIILICLSLTGLLLLFIAKRRN